MINTFICKVFVCKLRNFKKENTKKGENIYKPPKSEDVGIFHPNLKKREMKESYIFSVIIL